jgi:hypothetical protein
MHGIEAAPPPDRRPWRLPRRDYALLPLLSLLTVLAMLGAAEIASRLVFTEHEQDACMATDPQLGTRFRPNCTSRVKAMEGPWVVNEYNACGYRTPQPCGPKPAGAVRIAVLGSSMAQGYLVPYRETFAARAAGQLAQSCRRPVEFQNLASIGYVWTRLAARVGDALALRPDAAVIVVVPFDLQQSETPPAREDPQPSNGRDLMKKLDSLASNSRAIVAAQHFLFTRPDIYVQLYLGYGDRADFLRPPFGPLWQRRLSDFDRLLAGIADRFHTARIPLFLVYVPQRAQAALLAAHQAPTGVDPRAFGRRIGEIAARHGVQYVDTSAAFSRLPQAADLYYPVDGHLSGRGDAVLARAVAGALGHDVAALQSCASADFTVDSATQ